VRREVIPELLDDDIGTPAEIAASIADLRAINSRFGGINTTASMLRRVAAQCGSRRLTMLDVAAGGGDLAAAARTRMAAHRIELAPTLLDRMTSHLAGSSAPAVCGDALQLPFADGAFDVVNCSLFAHHLAPGELQQFVAEGLRVCRRAVLINDLIRSRLHLWLVYAGLPSFRSRLTRHDAPASVRNAYTVREMRRLLRDLPAERIEISRHFLFRMGVLVWKLN
jgi:2-polyprenyl-3-methyl-5-hydroxy-6-metoxy-1,4-benzoquinol methylase